MRVYSPDLPSAAGFEWVMPVEEADHDQLRVAERCPIVSEWEPVRMALLREDEGRRMDKLSDAPWYGRHVMILRPPAVQVVEDLLRGQAELLPLECDEELWLLHVTEERDALDEARSDIVRFPSTGRVMRINRHEFLPDRLEGATWFKIPQQSPGAVYFNEEVASVLRSASLRGVGMTEVWRTGTQ